jgi:quaternary ammonium compound-resistance protein SugE
MAWIVLLFAGLLETAWATGLKAMATNFSLALIISTAMLMITSIAALYWSMRVLPLGIAYPIWTGIGSIGSLIVSIVLFKQHVGMISIIGVVFLLVGIFLISLETH